MRTERRLSVRIRPAAWRRQRTGPGALPGLSLRTLFAVGVDQEPQLLHVNAVLLVALWLDAVLERLQEFLPCHHHLSATRGVLGDLNGADHRRNSATSGPPRPTRARALRLRSAQPCRRPCPGRPGTVLPRPRCPPSRS